MPAQQNTKYGQVWGSAKAAGELHDLKLPSGEVCQVRRPGVTGLMSAGVLADLDVLTSLVEEKHIGPQRPGKKPIKGKPKAKDDVAVILKDPSRLDHVRRVALKVVAYMVVQPTVRLHFRESEDPRDGKVIHLDIPIDERDMTPDPDYPDNPVIYTDQVDFEDAMFLFSYAVGGTRELAQFRGKFQESLASLESGQDIPDLAKHGLPSS